MCMKILREFPCFDNKPNKMKGMKRANIVMQVERSLLVKGLF